jgi:hypothetical protein
MKMWWQSRRSQHGGTEAGTPPLLLASPWDGAAGIGWTPSPVP